MAFMRPLPEPPPEVQVPIGMELMAVTCDTRESLRHAGMLIAFRFNEETYGIPGRRILDHLRLQLEAMRTRLLARQATGGRRDIQERYQDGLDVWEIIYELLIDGETGRMLVVKKYTQATSAQMQFEVVLDSTGHLELPQLPEGVVVGLVDMSFF